MTHIFFSNMRSKLVYLGGMTVITASLLACTQNNQDPAKFSTQQPEGELVAQNVSLNYPSIADNSDNDNEEKNRILLTLILQILTQQHYQPLAIDDEFAGKIFNLFLERMDNSKRYFTQADYKKLKALETSIDNQIMQGDYKFFDTAFEIFEERLKASEQLSNEILETPFDFTIDEKVELDGDKVDFAKNENERKDKWRKLLKYQTMIRLDELLKEEEKKQKEDANYKAKSVQELEEIAREKVKKSQNEFFKRMYRLDKKDWRSLFLNSITNIYDPHTAYFPPKDKEDFDIAFTGQFEGIGATLQEREGEIKVIRIVPGSASWKQGELQEGDVIMKVAQGEEEPVSIVDMPLDDAVRLIRGKKGTEVRLTVKKIDGTIKVIPIIRDVVILEETYAKSAILGDGKDKIGYIKLPSFYANFQGENGRSSANDMRNEIIKLQEENIQGLVLDLRNNGGGSLADVIQIVGLFIKDGPVLQVKSRGAQPKVYSDNDKSIFFDKPLVVLVNEFSASASEIFAAAIQDYRRGIVIGTPTFGKGTVQQFIELDRTLGREYDAIKPLGSLKLTIQKYYRINGGATQLKGVVPDIILPDNYAYVDFGEEQEPFAMQWDEIKKARYQEWKVDYDLTKIKKSCQSRIEKNKLFNMIEANAKRLKERQNQTLYTLHLDTFRNQQRQLEAESKKYEELIKANAELKVSVLQKDKAQIEADTVKKASFENFQKELAKDVYVMEAMNVLNQVQ